MSDMSLGSIRCWRCQGDELYISLEPERVIRLVCRTCYASERLRLIWISEHGDGSTTT